MKSQPEQSAPRPSWWRRDLTARQVRILSIVALAAMAAGFLKPLVTSQTGMDIGSLWLRIIGFLVASHVAGNFAGGRAPLPGQLDERQLSERALALNMTYIVIGLCLCALVLWSLGIERVSLLQGERLTIDSWLLHCLFLLHLMLPGTILAWRDHGLEPEE